MTLRVTVTTTRAARVLCVATLAVGLAACTGSGHHASSSAPAPSSPPSTPPPAPSSASASSSSPTPQAASKPRRKPVNPFTGLGPVPKKPVIAVKVDDTAPGRPQRGIDRADIVYIEAVEGGLTRLAAIYATHQPTVGYVRSTRPSDPDLLLQYGKITEAYSGGAHDSLPRVHRSGITSWSDDAGAAYYFRVFRPESTYINLVLNLAKVAKHVKTPRAHSIGWTFNRSLAGFTSSRARMVRTTVTGSYQLPAGTPVQFRWKPKLGKYVRYINGVEQFAADGKPVAATNVIVQDCKVVSHPEDTDVDGNPSQFTYTVGSGRVAVFRGGRRVNGTWSRAHLDDGTRMHARNGKLIPLAPGNTWVVLIRKGVPVFG
jgi:hypothetical protein